jgi:hypothetical protein
MCPPHWTPRLRSDAEAPPLHFHFLNRRLDLPLHLRWASWLWERGMRTGEIMALESWGVQGPGGPSAG